MCEWHRCIYARGIKKLSAFLHGFAIDSSASVLADSRGATWDLSLALSYAWGDDSTWGLGILYISLLFCLFLCCILDISVLYFRHLLFLNHRNSFVLWLEDQQRQNTSWFPVVAVLLHARKWYSNCLQALYHFQRRQCLSHHLFGGGGGCQKMSCFWHKEMNPSSNASLI